MSFSGCFVGGERVRANVWGVLSGVRDEGSEAGGAEEDGACQGEEDAGVGEAVEG